MTDEQVEWTRNEWGDLNSRLGHWWHGNGVAVFDTACGAYTEDDLREILRGLDLFRAPVATPEEGGP